MKGDKANLKQYNNLNRTSIICTEVIKEERSTTPLIPSDEGSLLQKGFSFKTPTKQTGLITGAPPRTPPIPRVHALFI